MVRDILVERGKSYGKYSDGVRVRKDLLKVLNMHSYTVRGEFLPEELVIPLGDIIMKLTRMAADPYHEDNYTDLAGYAELLREMHNEGK